jgi:hypothetical protein
MSEITAEVPQVEEIKVEEGAEVKVVPLQEEKEIPKVTEPITVTLTEKQLVKFQKVNSEKALLQKQFNEIDKQFKVLSVHEGDLIDLILESKEIDSLQVAKLDVSKDGKSFLITLK